MKNTFILALTTLVFLLSNCSSVKVLPDQKIEAEFIQYKTYSFLAWQKDSDQILNEFDKKSIHDAFKTEFQKRELQYLEKGGDMTISLYCVLSKETSISAYTNYYGSYGGRYGGRYNNGWGGGYKATSYSKNNYLKGTLVMDVFDEKDGEQIWQAVVKSIGSEKPRKNEQSIHKTVSVLMKKFPLAAVINKKDKAH